jgi:predicted Zn-dependent peptidase
LPITGTLETLERFDEAVLRAHHRAHYTTRMVVSVAGPVVSDVIARTIERVFALPAGLEPESAPPPSALGPRFEYLKHRGSQTALRFGFRAPGEHAPLEPATEVLLRVLDDGMSTRLYHRICDERGLCYDVSANYEAYADAGLFDVAAETSHEQASAVIEEIFSITEALCESGPTERELAKVKARFRWQLREMLDSPPELIAFYGLGELSGVARTPEERIAELEAVDADRVRTAAQQVFSRENLTLAAVGTLSRGTRSRIERRLA